MGFIFLLLVVGVSWPTQQQPLSPEKHVQQVIASLPSGSEFRRQLEKGARGNGVHQDWMSLMRSLGVRRAVLILDFEWHGKPVKIIPRHAIYFDKYDTDCAQIMDPDRLQKIRTSGLEKQLEEFAIEKTASAHWFYVDKKPHAKRGTSRVEFMDDEWLPNAPPILRPSEDTGKISLIQLISIGDEKRVAETVSRPLSHAELDGALFAASSNIDDSCIISTLLKAGANPNAQNTEKQAPLMYASEAGHIGNVKTLLQAGADVNAQNISGKTAIFFAQKQGRTDVVRLLEEASR